MQLGKVRLAQVKGNHQDEINVYEGQEQIDTNQEGAAYVEAS